MTRTTSLAGALLLGALTACSHGGSGSASAAGSGTVITFALADMEGDWIGQMVPDSPSKPKRNFYLRVVNGVLVEASDSARSRWNQGDAVTDLSLEVDGDFDANMSSLAAASDLVLSGSMVLDKSTVNGTYSYNGASLLQSEGTFTLTRSSGPGHFDLDQIVGDWEGFGYNMLANRRDMELQLDLAGDVMTARIFRATGTDVHTYAAGAGTFAYFDDSIGLLEDVVMIATDGAITTFEYLLVDEDGTLMGGAANDTKLGDGIIELRRPQQP